MVQQTVKEHIGSTLYPMLMRTNYTEWAALMRVKMQHQGIWDPIEDGVGSEHPERNALPTTLQAVLPELPRAIPAKDNAKDAWNDMRTMRIGVERVW